MKIGFVGLGKLGKEVSEVMSCAGHVVEGYDINPETKPEGVVTVNSVEEVVKEKDLVFIAVPTPHDPQYDGMYPCMHLEPKDFDYSIVKEVLQEVDKYATKDQLVALISTVLPGTIRREFIPLIHNFRFIYNPYLIAMGTVKEDMIEPEMVIIGTEDGSTTSDAKILIDFYKTIINPNIRFEVGTWDEAESIKIFYNTFISTKVAFVNMIQDVAEKVGNIDVDVVTTALANSNYRITGKTYMKPGMGDGGGCHPRDNIALRWMAKHYNLGYDFFQGIMQARESQAKNLAEFIENIAIESGLPVIILGKSYKPGVEYINGSSSILVGSYITKVPVEYDPEIPYQAVYLRGHCGGHLLYKYPRNSIVIDPWREYVNKSVTVIPYGNTRSISKN